MRDLGHAVDLGDRSDPGAWRTPVVRAVATTGDGVVDVVSAIEDHRAWLGTDGLTARRVRRAGHEIEGLALATLRARVGGLSGDTRLEVLAGEVVAGRSDPYAAADALVRSLT